MSEMERVSASYSNLSQRFNQECADFSKQYCTIYLVRLRKMQEILQNSIAKKWGDTYPICKLHKLSEENYPKCIVMGTIFKDQKLKPSILKQLAEANSLVPPPVYSHFTDESDSLFIEDELQRYELQGNLDKATLVTGISCAILGTDIGKGKFLVEDVCFADFQPQAERPLLNEDLFVVFLSGLDVIHQEKTSLSLPLLIDWLSGFLPKFHDIDVRKIVRLVIAGNSVCLERVKSTSKISMTSRTKEAPEIIDAVKVLDEIFLELAQVIELDVLPGSSDPSNYILPQKPMHHCMFPKSMRYKSLNQVSNPYECDIEGVRILGTAGQPVTDLLGFCDVTEASEALESCLKWGHIAPTAPDTLGCFPYSEEDPFILEHCPHVLFAGNQKEFATKLCTGGDGQQVRLISIPVFAESGTVAVLNLRNLECFPLVFRNF